MQFVRVVFLVAVSVSLQFSFFIGQFGKDVAVNPKSNVLRQISQIKPARFKGIIARLQFSPGNFSAINNQHHFMIRPLLAAINPVKAADGNVESGFFF